MMRLPRVELGLLGGYKLALRNTARAIEGEEELRLVGSTTDPVAASASVVSMFTPFIAIMSGVRFGMKGMLSCGGCCIWMAKLRNEKIVEEFPLVSFSGRGIESTTLSRELVTLSCVKVKYRQCTYLYSVVDILDYINTIYM